MSKKRGISPLLAAVLLVAFSITLAALVSTFIIKKAREFNPDVIAQESVLCDGVSLGYTVSQADIGTFGISRPNGAPASVEVLGPLTLTNRGSFSIHRLIITAAGVPSVQHIFTDPPGVLSPQQGNNRATISIQVNRNLPDKEIKIVPVINDTEKNQLVRCTDKQVSIDYVKLCTEVGRIANC